MMPVFMVNMHKDELRDIKPGDAFYGKQVKELDRAIAAADKHWQLIKIWKLDAEERQELRKTERGIRESQASQARLLAQIWLLITGSVRHM